MQDIFKVTFHAKPITPEKLELDALRRELAQARAQIDRLHAIVLRYEPSAKQEMHSRTTITPEMIIKLREAAEAPLMACKKALVYANGDHELALSLLIRPVSTKLTPRTCNDVWTRTSACRA